MIPAPRVLATPQTIRDAFMTLSHDYWGRFPEVETATRQSDGRMLHRVSHPGWPGGDEADFTMDDVGFLRDVLNRPGGHYRQYECVVESPPEVYATVVRIYRIGTKVIRSGNDDPHGG